MAEGDRSRLLGAIGDAHARLLDYARATEQVLDDELTLLAQLHILLFTTDVPLGDRDSSLWDELRPSEVFQPRIDTFRETIPQDEARQELSQDLRFAITDYLWAARSLIVTAADGEVRERTLPEIAEIAKVLDVDAAQRSAERAKAAQRQAEESAERARAAAGDTATHELAAEYIAVVAAEDRAANWYRWGTIGLLVVSAVESAYFALGFEDLETSQIVARLAIAVPLLALAAYLGRESAQHRQLARAYRSTAVQLKTVGAYADMLGDEGEQELLLLLGKAVYTGPPATPDAEDEAATTAIPLVDLIPLLQGLLGRPAEKLS